MSNDCKKDTNALLDNRCYQNFKLNASIIRKPSSEPPLTNKYSDPSFKTHTQSDPQPTFYTQTSTTTALPETKLMSSLIAKVKTSCFYWKLVPFFNATEVSCLMIPLLN